MTAYTDNHESIENYYQRLSLQRGIKIKPPERAARQIGYNLVNQEKVDAAIKVFKYNITLHPDSPDTQYGLAYGHDINGDLQAALAQANKALSVVDESHAYYDFFANAQKKLNEKFTKQKN